MKSKIVAIVFSSFLLTSICNAQIIGTVFPEMETETAEDKVVILPAATKGKFTLLGLAYSKKSEDDLNTWFSPIYNTFLRESTGVFASFAYDVNVYFIPMFTGVMTAATGTAKNKALKHLDSKLLPYILFYKGKLKEYKEQLQLGKKNLPYFFVLDEKGEIIHATSGKYSDEKMAEIEAVLE